MNNYSEEGKYKGNAGSAWTGAARLSAIAIFVGLATWMAPNSAAQAMSPAQPAMAAAPDTSSDTTPDSPCKHLSPMPAEMLQQQAAMAEARKAGKPMPPRTPEDLAAYTKYQQQGFREDFGGNCRYEAANAALPPATGDRVVFFGDSITEGWLRADPALFTGNVIDRGISGQTTTQMLVRFRQDVVDLHPRAVHILAGVNDLAGNTGPSSVARVASNIMSMVDIAKANHIQVALGVLPAAVIPWRREINVSTQMAALSAWMKDYAAKNGIIYVDYYSKFVGDGGAFNPQLTADGVHPNAAGFKMMGPMATDALHLGK
jgi:acyl-CoA thioesterase I